MNVYGSVSGAGRWPRNMVIQIDAAPSAIKRSGIAPASAPKIKPGKKCPIKCRAATGAGCNALRMLPGGAVTVTGRKLPSLCGTSGAIAHFTAKLV